MVSLLLLQARLPDDPMKEHERQCFVRASGLEDGDVVTWSLLDGPPSAVQIRRFDALTVGGSGDFYVTQENLPRFDELLERLREVVDDGHPTFASCFGYQLLVRALGGEIVHDSDNTEVGSFDLVRTVEGAADELFGTLPATFVAQLGHKERAARHPDGVPNLAASQRSPFQALRVPNKPIWATQFHPELDRETNLDRFRHYLSAYAAYMDAEQREEIVTKFRESPETSALLGRFFALVFG
jgi:GMP synthase (glutamine-hydrolysing)